LGGFDSRSRTGIYLRNFVSAARRTERGA